MINKNLVFKIRATFKRDNSQAWVHGHNVCLKVGGSGKTWTSSKIVRRNLEQMKKLSEYKRGGVVLELVTFSLNEISSETVE